MNEKILAEIYVPAAGESYDVWIPKSLRIRDLVMLLSEALSSLVQGQFQGNPGTGLFWRGSGELLDMNRTVRALGLENGAELMLI